MTARPVGFADVDRAQHSVTGSVEQVWRYCCVFGFIRQSPLFLRSGMVYTPIIGIPPDCAGHHKNYEIVRPRLGMASM